MNTLKSFRLVGLLEGISFLFLVGIAMPLKYIYHQPMAVRIGGMAHGVLFIAYIFFLMKIRSERNWSTGRSVGAFIASLLPFGTIVFDMMVLRFEKK